MVQARVREPWTSRSENLPQIPLSSVKISPVNYAINFLGGFLRVMNEYIMYII